MKPHENLDPLTIGGKAYASRLLVGTGKYKDFAETKAAIEASGARIVTVAIRGPFFPTWWRPSAPPRPCSRRGSR